MDEVKFAALDAATDAVSRLDFWRNDSPKCPHCGETFDISRHDWYHLYEEGEHSVTCPDCDWDFAVYTNIAFTFSTDEQERDEATQPPAGKEEAAIGREEGE